MRKTFALFLLGALLLNSCQQLFTTPLAAALAREPKELAEITAAGAAILVETLAANPDPALAQAALGALADLAASSSDAAVVSNAASVAVIATGFDLAVSSALTQLDVPALIEGGGASPSDEDVTIIVEAFSSVTVSPDAAVIFDQLAAQTPQELAEAGVEPTVLIIAAASIALMDMQEESVSLEDVISGTTPYAPSAGVSDKLQSLADALLVVAPDSQYASLLNGFLGFQ